MRLVRTVIAATAGAAAGDALYQMREGKHHEDGMHDITVAAHPANIAAGAVIGLVAGSPVAAFAVGLGLSAVLGPRFEEALKAYLVE